MRKVVRTISWKTYGAALAITTIVFAAGIYVGTQIEKSALAGVGLEIESVKAKMISLETMLLFERSPFFCDFFLEEVEKFDRETGALGEKIKFMELRGVDPRLKADYMVLEFRDYLLVREVDARCGRSSTTVLYFLSSSKCLDCWKQAEELNKAREKIAGLRVYSFDLDVASPLSAGLRKKYGVEAFPTLFAGDSKFVGLTSSDAIAAALVSS